jgi:hypothetical protein
MPEDLADLIAAHKGALSFGDLADASGVTDSTWQRWAVKDKPATERAISITSVKLIAATLSVSERRVWLAVGATHGLNVAAPSETPLSLALSGFPLDDLTPKQVDLIAGVTGELLAAQARRQDEIGAPVRQLRAARKTTGNEKRGTGGNSRTGRTK